MFNKAQHQKGLDTVGDLTAQYRPKVAIHPQYTDYCDTCQRLKEDISRKEAIMKQLIQSGNSTEEELQLNEEAIQVLHTESRQHAIDAANLEEAYLAGYHLHGG